MPNNLFQFVQSVASILSSIVAIIAGVRGALRYLRLRKVKQAGQLAYAPAGRAQVESPYAGGMPRPGLPTAAFPPARGATSPSAAPPGPNATPPYWSPAPGAPEAGRPSAPRPASHVASWWRVVGAGAAIFFSFVVVLFVGVLVSYILVPSFRTNQYTFEALAVVTIVPAGLLAGSWGGWIARERNSALTALLLELIVFLTITFIPTASTSTRTSFPTLSSTTKHLNILLAQGIILAGVLWGVELRARRARATQWRS